jgi:hypothetical protein
VDFDVNVNMFEQWIGYSFLILGYDSRRTGTGLFKNRLINQNILNENAPIHSLLHLSTLIAYD